MVGSAQLSPYIKSKFRSSHSVCHDCISVCGYVDIPYTRPSSSAYKRELEPFFTYHKKKSQWDTLKDASFLWGELTSVRLATFIYLHSAHTIVHYTNCYIALVLLYANVKRSVWRPLIYHSASHTRVFPWATFTHHRSIRFVYTLVYGTLYTAPHDSIH